MHEYPALTADVTRPAWAHASHVDDWPRIGPAPTYTIVGSGPVTIDQEHQFAVWMSQAQRGDALAYADLLSALVPLARRYVPFEGLPARIAWLGHGERTVLARAVNAMVAKGELDGPVAFSRDHLDAVSTQLLIQRIAVVGAITDQILRLGFDHVEVEAQLHQADFVMVGRMRAYR